MKKITLRAARSNANLTQAEAAKKIGVSRDTIANWENGKTSPSVGKFKRIEAVYGISYDELDFLANITRNE